MRLYSPRHLGKSHGLRWLGPLWAMPLSLGVAALAAILLVLVGLVAMTSTDSSPPSSRPGTGTTVSPVPTSSARNLVADAGFDHDVAAWRPLPGAFVTRGSTAEEEASFPMNGQAFARVQRDPNTPVTTDPQTGGALYGMVMPVIQSASRGTHLHARVQVRATRSKVAVLLRLSELAGGQRAARSEVRTLLTDTAWHLLEVDREVRTAGATIQVEVGAFALPPDAAVYVDNVRVLRRP
jgi:hypothetical protein